MADGQVRIGRVKPAYVCATPPSECGGKLGKYSSGIRANAAPKTHSTPQECHKCMCRYLLNQGYEQRGGREFCKGDGPVVLLNKPSRGYRLRGGKGDRYMSRGNTGGFMYSQ